MSRLTVDELLAGARATHAVEVPARLLGDAGHAVEGNGDAGAAGAGEGPDPGEPGATVVLRPLTVRDVQRLSRAAGEDGVLSSILMVQQALVEPALSVEEVGDLSAGLLQFLLARVNDLSGLSLESDELEAAVRAPLARACFVLAREFGWTADTCSELTVGQVLLYLEMLARDEGVGEVTPP